MTFVDTSVPGRVLDEGPRKGECLELFRSDRPLFGSSLLVAELMRVAVRREDPLPVADRLLRRVDKLALDDTVLREAGLLSTPGTWVRAADAIHLVCALRLGEQEFLTYDRVQARGAESLGLQVHSPGMADGWWR